MFTPTPQQILLLGTGGGAIARFFAHHEPACPGDAIEQSEAVAHIARQFFDFPDTDTGWQLHIETAQHYIENSDKQYDLIVLDIAEDQRTPLWVSDTDFLEHCQQRLTKTGMLVINLIPHDADDFIRMLPPIRQAFPLCTACLSVPTQHNVLVFCFRELPDTQDAESRIPHLNQQWNLPFAEFLQRFRTENPVGSGIF